MTFIEPYAELESTGSPPPKDRDLQRVIDAIELPIIRTDREERVQGLNNAATQIVGFPREACIGKTCESLFNLKGSTGGSGTIHRAITMAESQVADTVVYPMGRPVPIRFRASPLFDDCGEVDGAVNYLVRDLSEEQALIDEIRRLSGRIAAGDLDARVDSREPGTQNAVLVDLINGIVDLLAGQVRRVEGEAQRIAISADEAAKVLQNVRRLAEGSLDLDLSVGTADPGMGGVGEQFAAINDELARVVAALTRLIGDTSTLVTAAVHGRFRARADDQGHQGVYRSVIRGMNTALDTLADSFDQMPVPVFTVDDGCTIQYINRQAAEISGVSPDRAVGMPCADLICADTCGSGGCVSRQCIQQHQQVRAGTAARPRGGMLEIELTAIPIPGPHGRVLGAVEFVRDVTTEKAAVMRTEKLARFVDREAAKVVEALEQIAAGRLSLPAPVAAADQDTRASAETFEAIHRGIGRTVACLNTLVADTAMIATAAGEGNLAARVDPTRHQGDYRRIVEGFNDTLEALIGGLNLASDSIDQIGKGVIPPRVTAGMAGEFDHLKTNINACIDGLEGLVEANAILKRMAVNDHRTGVEGDYPGLFGEVKDHVNTVRDRVNHIAGSIEKIGRGDLTEYQEYRAIGRRSEADRVVPGFVRTLEHLRMLTEDAEMLAQSAIEGRLERRADASRHDGEYRTVVEGINGILDAVVAPLNEAKHVSQAYARAEFSTRMDRSIPVAGEFLAFREALDQIGVGVSTAIGAIASVSEAYAGYDFTTRIDASTHLTGDLVKMGEALDRIGVEISGAIGVTKTQIHDLNDDLTGVRAQVEEISRGAQQVATSTIDVSANTEKAMLGTQQVLHAMEDMSAAVEEVTASMESVAHLAKETDRLSTDGAQLAAKAEASIDAIGTAGETASRIVNEIGGQMNDIGKIVRIIRELANQTNLLALNAAIEAARAGEHGRGFAVVASEVKSLAQESRNSAEHIEELIGALRAKSAEALTAMNEASSLIVQGDLVIDETVQSFNRIVEAVQKISQNTEEVASASEEQAAAIQEITASIHEVTSLIEETNRDATDVASATEESTASIEEISRMVGEAEAFSDRIRDEIAVFRV